MGNEAEGLVRADPKRKSPCSPGGPSGTVTDGERVSEVLKRIADSHRKRGHATYWHAANECQGPMEVGAVMDWAEQMNKRGCQIDIDTIKKNPDTYPDCIAKMDGEQIGVEVTELVDGNAIRCHPENPQYEGPEQFVREFQQPMPPKWSREKFEQCLSERVCRKDKGVKCGSLAKQFLLVVTDEPWLDQATLADYLRTIKLQPPRNFDGVYVMMSHVPNPTGRGRGHHPVFEVPWAE